MRHAEDAESSRRIFVWRYNSTDSIASGPCDLRRPIPKSLHDTFVRRGNLGDLQLSQRFSPTLCFAAAKKRPARAFLASFAKAGFLFSLLQTTEIGLRDCTFDSLAIRIPTQKGPNVAERNLGAGQQVFVANYVNPKASASHGDGDASG